MKKLLQSAAVLLLLSTINSQLSTSHAQGTAFTYQGRLNSGTSPANGSYDLRFALYDAASAGVAQGNLLTNTATAVSNGLFTVTLDFGNQFPGANRWLELAVRTNGSGAFSPLTPRQSLTPTPYAVTAGNISGVLAASQLPAGVVTNGATISGTFTGNGANVTNVNAATLGGVASAGFWQTTGNVGANPATGAYLGTSDNLPLEFRVNGQRALRLEPNGYGPPNVIGGSLYNFVALGVIGVTVGGGYFNLIQTNSDYSAIGGGYNNQIQPNAGYSSIGGGTGNQIQTNAFSSTIGGGAGNLIQANAYYSAVGGGGVNQIQPNASSSTIGGGYNNQLQANASSSTIGGGFGNQIQLNAHDSTIGGGNNNQIQTNASYSTIGGGSVNQIQTNASSSTIGGGYNNQIQPNAPYSTISGGIGNQIQPSVYYSTIGGGAGNQIQTNASASMIGGGSGNQIQPNAYYASIPGGYQNSATNFAFAAGNRAKAVTEGAFVWADSQIADFVSSAPNQFLIRAAGGVGIGTNNPQTALQVVGTVSATAFSGSGTGLIGVPKIAGGNSFSGSQTITNGAVGINTTTPLAPLHIKSASGDCEVAIESGDAGAHRWTLQSTSGFFGSQYLGAFQIIDRTVSAARVYITTNGFFGINTVTPQSMLDVNGEIHWGTSNVLSVNQSGSIELGNSAQAGTFPFIDFHFGTGAAQDFNTRIINSADQTLDIMRSGSATPMGHFTSGGLTVNGTFVSASDRNLKEHFKPVSAQEVLAKVATLPISRWNYKQDTASEHLGPMAQDFYAAFNVGPDDKHIAVVDESGVALAAIQGLNEKVEREASHRQKLETENAELKQQLAELKALVQSLAEKK